MPVQGGSKAKTKRSFIDRVTVSNPVFLDSRFRGNDGVFSASAKNARRYLCARAGVPLHPPFDRFLESDTIVQVFVLRYWTRDRMRGVCPPTHKFVGVVSPIDAVSISDTMLVSVVLKC